MRKISADYILPVSMPVIEKGVVIVDDDGKILSVGERKNFDEAELEMYSGIICPGLINAHCHLELSYMKGKIPARKGLIQFIIDLIDYRNGFALSDNSSEYLDVIYNEIRNALEEMRRNGIVGVGDISNDDYTFSFKARSALSFHTFVECFGFVPQRASNYFQQSLETFNKARRYALSASITPHAPYSVPPELFHLIFSFHENSPAIFSYHNQESSAENIFYESGNGDFLRLFNHFKIPQDCFKPTGKRSIESVINYFPPGKKTLFVHNTVSNENDVALIATQLPHSFFCFCPNANIYIENRLPDFSLFRKFPERICLGTDSYASNNQLSILEEMKTIQQYDVSISTTELLQWATLNGARFFGWEKELGSIEAGKKPGLNLITEVGGGLQLTPASEIQKLI